MTVKGFIQENGWIIDCDTSTPYRVMTVNIQFTNDEGKDDETQFDISAYNTSELAELFHVFCRENNFPENTVTNVYVVAVFESWDTVQ